MAVELKMFKKEFYHEPTRTTRKYVRKVRDVRVVRGKILL
jgi:hypothetical protein